MINIAHVVFSRCILFNIPSSLCTSSGLALAQNFFEPTIFCLSVCNSVTFIFKSEQAIFISLWCLGCDLQKCFHHETWPSLRQVLKSLNSGCQKEGNLRIAQVFLLVHFLIKWQWVWAHRTGSEQCTEIWMLLLVCTG